MDICYITPSGRRLRTFPEIQNHLDASGEDLTLDHFTFSKKVDLGEVLDSKVSVSDLCFSSQQSLGQITSFSGFQTSESMWDRGGFLYVFYFLMKNGRGDSNHAHFC